MCMWFVWFSVLVHIIDYLINVKCDGDDDNDAGRNQNNIKQKRRTPNGSIVLYNISDVINY